MKASQITGINHLSIVTADLDRAMRTWQDGYGIGPWRHFRFGPDEVTATVADESCRLELRVALASLAEGTRIELIEPLVDDPVYGASLRRHRGADHVHHISFNHVDYDRACAAFAAGGSERSLQARFRGQGPEELEVTYFESGPDLGVRVELAAMPPGFAIIEPSGTYPA